MKDNKNRSRATARVLAAILAVTMLLMSGAYLISAFVGGESLYVYAAGPDESGSDEEQLKRLEEIKALVEKIREYYKDEIPLKELVDGAYKGVFDLLDRWSVYYEKKDDGEEFFDNFSGDYVGIGIVLSQADGAIIIESMNPVGPAAKAGIKEGSRILSVNGTPLQNVDPIEAAAMIRGEENTEVTLVVSFGNTQKEYRLVRKRIKALSVSWELMEDKTGYIKIVEFTVNTGEEFAYAKSFLLSQGMEWLVLDLRNNGGGVLISSLEVADCLITSGPIIHYMQQGEIVHTHYASGRAGKTVPTALLINGGTASAAEALAGALQDSKAAVVIGSKSYGKGVAQSYIELGSGDAMKLSTFYFLTPNRKAIDGKGITPDYTVPGKGSMSPYRADALRREVLPLQSGVKYFYGQSGRNVLAVQQRLRRMGFAVSENGTMDDSTVEALKVIQRTYGGSPYGGLDFATTGFMEKAFEEFLSNELDTQFAKALDVLKAR